MHYNQWLCMQPRSSVFIDGDPGEHHDLAAEHPELVAEMVAEWATNWR